MTRSERRGGGHVEERRSRERRVDIEREARIRRRCIEAIRWIEQNTDLSTRDFPIEEHEEEMMMALENFHTILIQAETGAGKSLDIAAMIARSPELAHIRRIAMTQPRRDAAESVAVGMAARHGMQFGREVCFTTSEFHGNDRDTKIAIQTTAVLMNAFRDDALLEQYDCVIIDEAHERDINIDLCLALLKKANEFRRERNIEPIYTVIASATIDKEKFAEYINAPERGVFSVPGRMHPIEDHFKEPQKAGADSEKDEPEYPREAAEKVAEILASTDEGDVLVFMPGVRAIDKTITFIKEEIGSLDVEVMRLHGKDSMEHRANVLSGSKNSKRRVIVSTNMAETSVTVPNIRYVVDSCRKNQKTYDPNTGIDALTEVFATQAECQQRRGRAGRLSTGDYYPLLSQEEFEELEKFPVSEIRRAEISGVVLKLLNLGFTDIEGFDFIDKPDPKLIHDALYLLVGLGLVDGTETRQVTENGELANRLPLEPRLAAMVLAAEERRCLGPVIEMAALVQEAGSITYRGPGERAIQDVWSILREERNARIQQLTGEQSRFAARSTEREREEWSRYEAFLDRLRATPEKPEDILKGHAESVAEALLNFRREGMLGTKSSDWVALLNILRKYEEAEDREVFAEQAGLNMHALEKVLSVAARIRGEMLDMGIPITQGSSPEDVAECVLVGYAPDHVIRKTGGRRGVEFERVDRGDKDVRIAGSSVARRDPPSLAVALQLQEGLGRKTVGRGQQVETEFRYASGIHPVTPEQVFRVMPQRVRRGVKWGGGRIDDSGRVLLTCTYDFLDRKNAWVSLGEQEDVYAPGVEAQRELARNILASWGGDARLSNAPIFNVGENRVVAEELNALQNRLHILRDTPDLGLPSEESWKGLEEWYTQQLRGCASVQEALAVPAERFILSKEDMLSPDTMSALEIYLPLQFTIGAIGCPLEYTFVTGGAYSWAEEGERSSAHVKLDLTGVSIDALEAITDAQLRNELEEQVRILKLKSLPVRLTAKMYSRDGEETKNFTNLNELVEAMKSAEMERAWDWATREGRIPAQAPLSGEDDLSVFPDAGRYGAEPIEYGHRGSGEALIAYPAVALYQQSGSWSEGGSEERRYCIRYYASRSEASEAESIARGIFMERRTAVQEEQERVQINEFLERNVGDVQAQIEALKHLFVQAGMIGGRHSRRAVEVAMRHGADVARDALIKAYRRHIVGDRDFKLGMLDGSPFRDIILRGTEYESGSSLGGTIGTVIEGGRADMSALERLAGRFGASRGQDRDNGATGPVSPAGERMTTPKVETVVEEPATPEERKEIEKDLAYVRMLLDVARSFGKPRALGEKERPTDQDKARQRIHDGVMNAIPGVKEIESMLTVPATRLARLQGKLTSLRTSVEKLLTNNGATLDRGFELSNLEKAWSGVDDSINGNEIAREYVDEEIISRAELRAKVQELLKTRLSDITRGEYDSEQALADVLNQM